MYKYLPKEQRKWFDTVDNTEDPELRMSIEQMKLSLMSKKPTYHTTKKTRPKRTHLFKYLEEGCIFSKNKSNLY